MRGMQDNNRNLDNYHLRILGSSPFHSLCDDHKLELCILPYLNPFHFAA